MVDFVDFSKVSADLSQTIKGLLVHTTGSTNLTTIAANAAASTTVTIASAEVGDPVIVVEHTNLNNAAQVTGFVSAANTVTIRVSNNSAAAIDPAASVFTIIVFRVGDLA